MEDDDENDNYTRDNGSKDNFMDDCISIHVIAAAVMLGECVIVILNPPQQFLLLMLIMY